MRYIQEASKTLWEREGVGVENACQHTHTFTHPPRTLDQYLRAASLDPGPPAYFTFPYPSRTHPLSSVLGSPTACFSVLLSTVPPTSKIRKGYCVLNSLVRYRFDSSVVTIKYYGGHLFLFVTFILLSEFKTIRLFQYY